MTTPFVTQRIVRLAPQAHKTVHGIGRITPSNVTDRMLTGQSVRKRDEWRRTTWPVTCVRSVSPCLVRDQVRLDHAESNACASLINV